jgi:hypothetical protein
MNSKKMYFVMMGALVLCAGLIIGCFVLGNTLLQKKGDELLNKKLENAALDKQQETLKKAKEDIKKYSVEEAFATTIVPKQKDQALTILEIDKIADESNVRLSSISFPSSNLGQAVPKPAATQPADGSTPTPAPAPTSTVTQVKPTDGIKGVYQLEVTIQSDTSSPVRYADLLRFLTALEQNRSIGQINTINVQPTPSDRNLVTFNAVINVYIKL